MQHQLRANQKSCKGLAPCKLRFPWAVHRCEPDADPAGRGGAGQENGRGLWQDHQQKVVCTYHQKVACMTYVYTHVCTRIYV